MLYVFCPRLSNGAKELTEAVEGQRLRKFDGWNFWRKKAKVPVKAGDGIVCWGAELPPIEGIRLLNSCKPKTKLDERNTLSAAGVSTVTAAAILPKGHPGEWLPRSNYHVGGNDLLHKPAAPDFWSLKENFVAEYRLHSFNGRSIRAGKKVPRTNNPHPWIRSYDAGWKIDYEGFDSPEEMRKLARVAVKALGLEFGAVDIGERANGTLVVLEVNRAPGLEGNTITKYAEQVTKWYQKLEEGENGDPFKKPRRARAVNQP